MILFFQLSLSSVALLFFGFISGSCQSNPISFASDSFSPLTVSYGFVSFITVDIIIAIATQCPWFFTSASSAFLWSFTVRLQLNYFDYVAVAAPGKKLQESSPIFPIPYWSLGCLGDSLLNCNAIPQHVYPWSVASARWKLSTEVSGWVWTTQNSFEEYFPFFFKVVALKLNPEIRSG